MKISFITNFEMGDRVVSVLNDTFSYIIVGFYVAEVDKYGNVLHYKICCTDEKAESFYFKEDEIKKIEVLK